jgi:hypothetical protein
MQRCRLALALLLRRAHGQPIGVEEFREMFRRRVDRK